MRSLEFIFTVKSGFPIFQLWLAAPAPATTISGTIATADATPVPPGIIVDLEKLDLGTIVATSTADQELLPPTGAEPYWLLLATGIALSIGVVLSIAARRGGRVTRARRQS